MRIRFLMLTLAFATAACASGGSSPASTSSKSAAPRNPDIITADELHAANYSNLYDAIRHLRPGMLAPHGGSGSSQTMNMGQSVVSVYQDGVKMDGGIAALREISPESVHEVRYLSATDASQQYGTGNTAGAIIVSSH